MYKPRIIHLDMDSFFASVELARNPQWRKLPVVIGSSYGNRGIVTTANYVARTFGIGSATPMFKAKKLCKNLVVLNSDMQAYKEASAQISQILYSLCANVDFASIDEAYLDISYKNFSDQEAVDFVGKVRAEIFAQTGLSSSAGLASNRILAKIASEKNKPDGEFYILAEDEAEFIDNLEVKKIAGVGKKLAEKLELMHIKTCLDLKNSQKIRKNADSFLLKLLDFAEGKNLDLNKKESGRKSISFEKSFLQNISSLKDCEKVLSTMFAELNLRKAKVGNAKIKGIFIKLRFANFTQISREKSTQAAALPEFLQLLQNSWTEAPVRLLGIGYKVTE